MRISCLALVAVVTLLTLAGLGPSTMPAARAADTMMQDGIWIMNTTSDVVQAEIDKKSETICLPRIEFTQEVDPAELQKALKDGIKRQGAIFHLYHDGLGRPKRIGNLLFSQDVYLKDLKMTYIGYLRSLGYKFKISKTPAFEDPAYLRNVQSGAYLAEKRQQTGAAGTAGGPGSTGTDAGRPDQPARPGQPAQPLRPIPSGGSGDPNLTRTSWDVMPAGVLPPGVRKTKKELDEKIREIKNRPYQKEIIQVDPVRWASGRMGRLAADGTIIGAVVEGQRPLLRLRPPAGAPPDWLTPARIDALASQPCEFILHRSAAGRDLVQQGVYPLADIYFVDLGLTWNDWLTSEGLPPAPEPAEPGMATAPIRLAVKVVDGTWKGLKAPVLAEVAFPAAPSGVLPTELLRTASPERPLGDVKTFLARFNAATVGQPVSVSMLFCPDGRPYLELGQKRAQRVLFPKLNNKTLAILLQEMAGPSPGPR
ncbi:MAG: hypothetical protein OZSIB_3993 [Candidatus Ozemobacter sibiricus]|jgi:hypothetical protein|uniref:TNase-like domain-containing protein n=1 Tax=Candidatus Ozemobacter sibiricus TaxID=2268124 RepID=A0A367ZQ24_9BACT|nr:MAG: hypothetical protein OZSIB_3993 [Candidatus Ozemobacter sibiricus]